MFEKYYMGQNYQDGKYALFVSLFVSFHGDLELTSTLNTVMAWLCLYGKWAQFNTIND